MFQRIKRSRKVNPGPVVVAVLPTVTNKQRVLINVKRDATVMIERIRRYDKESCSGILINKVILSEGKVDPYEVVCLQFDFIDAR